MKAIDVIQALNDLSPILVSIIFMKTLDVSKPRWQKRIKGQLIRNNELKGKSGHIINIVKDVNTSLGFVSAFIPIVIATVFQLIKESLQKDVPTIKWLLFAFLMGVLLYSIYTIYTMRKKLITTPIQFTFWKWVLVDDRITYDRALKMALLCGYICLIYIVGADFINDIIGIVK